MYMRKNESGRSMAEMLGVLAIMGVLSIAGINGYTNAVSKSRSNDILQGVSARAMMASLDRTQKGSITLSGFANNISGYPVNVEDEDTGFVIKVSQVPERVCNLILENKPKMALSVYGGAAGELENACASGDNVMAFGYQNTLSTTVSEGGEEDPSEETEPTSCGAGYWLDGTECRVCAAGTYAAAGAESCTTCPGGTYSSSGASSCTECEEGTYAAAGSSSCTACPAGTYAGAGATSCTDCPSGKTSPMGSTSVAACEEDPNCNTNLALATDQDNFCNEKCLSGCEVGSDDSDYPSWGCPSWKKDGGIGYRCRDGKCTSWSCSGSAAGEGIGIDQCEYDSSAVDFDNRCILTAGHPARTFCSCFTADTPITLASGEVKRVDEITYEDELLVWNFDEGRFDRAKPLWLQKPLVSPSYNLLEFSDGSVLKTINQHRIFNREAGKFTYPMTDETPIGTTTLNAKGEWVRLVEKRVVEEDVTYYNIITDYYINCFAGNILTSCRLNNLYPIKDLKFVKDDRVLVGYERFKEVDRKWYEGLRLAEQPEEINHKGDVVFDKSLLDYVQRLIRNAQ